MNVDLIKTCKIEEALTSALNDKGVFIINSKERNIPFESVLFTGETLRNNKNKKDRISKLIISSDKRGSGKTLSCLAYALAEVYYYNNSITIFTVPNQAFINSISLTFKDAISKLNELAGNDISLIQIYRNQLIFSNGSRIIFTTYRSLDNILCGQTADLIIFDEAQYLSEDLYLRAQPCCLLKKNGLLLMSITNTEIPPEAFINKLF